MPFLSPVKVIGEVAELCSSLVFKFRTVYMLTWAVRAFAGGSNVTIASESEIKADALRTA